MINTKELKFEKILQDYRFRMVKPFLKGDVLDFGGNDGELRKYVNGSYTIVNYDRSKMFDNKYDTIVLLAVIEHIDVSEVHKIFKEFSGLLNKSGNIFLTTPTLMCKPVLEVLSRIGILSRENILEHKHYWSKKDIQKLASDNGFKVLKYKKFQLGLNQMAVFCANN
jgi:2-polyprenyl-3-methyl-5-hydroxy-6-metoxy-1,4-benzoquinol methylase